MPTSSRYVGLVLAASAAGLVISMSSAGCGAEGSSESDLDASVSVDGQSSGFLPTDAGHDTAFDPDGACATTTVTAKRAPANILFVVDRSGSMVCNPPPTTSSQTCEQTLKTDDPSKPTKWAITKDAIKSAVAAMPAEDSAGLSYFNIDNLCAVQATPSVPVKPISPQQLQLLGQSLDNVTPAGNTPLIGGVVLGYHHMHTSTFAGRKFVVVISDGQDTCADTFHRDRFFAEDVANALAVGIRTFAIGVPGSEPARSVLSRIAFLGGTAKSPTCNKNASPPDLGDCHFDLTDPNLNLTTALKDALDKVSKEALVCEYDVPVSEAGVTDLGKVNVIYAPAGGAQQTIPQDTSKSCLEADGWQYSADKQRIVLCGPTCEKVKADTTGSISIALGCVTQVR